MTAALKFVRTAAMVVALFVIVNMAISASGFDLSALVFLAWNVAPCILAYAAVTRRTAAYPAAGFAVGALGLTLLMHAQWMFDIGGAQTGSSTSALIFIFIPVYAVATGLIGAVVGAAVGFGLARLR